MLAEDDAISNDCNNWNAASVCTAAQTTGNGGTHGGTAALAASTIAVGDYSKDLGIGSVLCAGATFTWVRQGPIDFLFIV